MDIYAASRNAAREVTVQIELIPPAAEDLSDELARLPLASRSRMSHSIERSPAF